MFGLVLFPPSANIDHSHSYVGEFPLMYSQAGVLAHNVCYRFLGGGKVILHYEVNHYHSCIYFKHTWCIEQIRARSSFVTKKLLCSSTL